MRRILAMTALLLLGACDQPLPDGSAPALRQAAGCRVRLEGGTVGMSGGTGNTIAMTNDGGWCLGLLAIRSMGNQTPHGEPMRIATPPQNGELDIVHMGRYTRVAYRPRPGFSGGDAFAVRGVETGYSWNFQVEVTP